MNTFTIKNRPGTKLAKIVSDAAGNEVGYIWKVSADTRATVDAWKANTLVNGNTENGVFVGHFHRDDYGTNVAAIAAAVAAIAEVIAA